jgi:thermitase
MHSPARPIVLAVALAALACGSAPAQSDTVIVKYRRGISAQRRQAISRRVGALEQTVGTVRAQRSRVVRVSGDPVAVARQLNRMRGVVYAEPDLPIRTTVDQRELPARTQVGPNDPLFTQLAGLRAIDAVAGWEAVGLASFPAGGGVRVGIVDTGIDGDHEDLRGKLVGCAAAQDGRFVDGSCGDDNDHGTHVAGTAGAIANNGVGIAGVAFNSPLVVCKALGGRAGSGTTADLANCIGWAHARGAKVISMSLGGPDSITLQNAVRLAWNGGSRRGSVLVAAAGNEGSAAVDYPAGYPEVVSVAATDSTGRHAGFSNSNHDVEVAAPGVDILSARRGGGYVRLSGTSMATPHVAGAAALLWDLHRSAAARTIRGRLDAAVADLGLPGRDAQFGFGMLDLAKIATSTP